MELILVLLCFLSNAVNDILPNNSFLQNDNDVIPILKDHYTRMLDGLYVEYDVYVIDKKQTKSHKLTVVEYLDNSSHFMRVVHWYHVDEYDFYGFAELDPIHNWYAWTPQKRTQVWLTKGVGHVQHSQVTKIVEPDIQFYSGYLGILPPDRICDIWYSKKVYSGCS